MSSSPPDGATERLPRVERTHTLEHAEAVERTAEQYWLTGMDLGYAKRRALVEHSRQEAAQMGQLRAEARRH